MTQREGENDGVRTYKDKFPIGTRIVVRAGPSEGSDHECTGRAGVIVSHGQWFGVRFDKPKRGWPITNMICPHNLVLEPAHD